MKMTEEEMLERRRKQQELDRLDAIKKLKICIVVGILSLIAVSYTHLDVYKRQSLSYQISDGR